MHKYVTVVCGAGRACSVLITHGNERTEPDCETQGIFRASAKLSYAQAPSTQRQTAMLLNYSIFYTFLIDTVLLCSPRKNDFD